MDRLSAGQAVLLLLFAIEIPLVGAATLAPGAAARVARRLVFAVPLAAALVLRTWVAFSVHGVLDWDETYYLSSAVTAARGAGLYPYVFGYEPMPILGGLGYAAYLTAAAVRIGGPSIEAVRAVSLLGAAAALAGVWVLMRRWYGSAAAWTAVALVANLRLFMLSNTARMDAWAFAAVAWALCAFAGAVDRQEWRGYLLAGAWFGLGLEVHPDTVVTAIACGLAILIAVRLPRADRLRFAAAFAAGWGAGLALFVAANVLRDPQAFYKTTAAIRVDATSWYSHGTSTVMGSFFDPRILFAKEAARYRALAGAVPWIERVLFAAGLLALGWRRTRADRLLIVLVPAVLVLTAIVLNNAAPPYFVHVLPVLTLPAAALLGAGVARRDTVALDAMHPVALAVAAAVVSAVCAVNAGGPMRTIAAARAGDPADRADAAFAARVRAVVPQACRVAGDARLYVRQFADYPLFISSRPTEVAYARLVTGAASDEAYWSLKAPEAVIGPAPLPPALAAYAARAGLVARSGDVFVRPGACTGGPYRPSS